MLSLPLTRPYPFTLLTISTLSRLVRNDYVSKPLSHGILDGRLLMSFEDLPLIRQSEITRQIGTERTTVLHDLNELGGSW
jgi:cleavage and polyadenylation specificity factor subunit 1